MNGKVRINVVYIKTETYTRIMALFRIPSKKWGSHRVPEFWGSFIDKFIETVEFQLMEKDAQIRGLKADVSNKDFLLKMKGQEIDRKNNEIEALKRQLADISGDNDKKAS